MIEDEIVRYFEKEMKPVLEKKMEEFLKQIPKRIDKILNDMEFADQGNPEPSCIRRCSAGERMTCKREIRKEVIIDLHRKGYLNDGKVFDWEFWFGD